VNTKEKKILMLGLIDPHKNDASKIHFYELANAFKNMGNDVDILVPINELKTNVCKVNRIFHLPLKYKENLLRIFLLSILQIIYYIFIASNEYDFVYIRIRLFPCIGFRLINILKNINTKIYAEQAGWLEKEIEIQDGNNFTKLIGKQIQLLDARFADKVIVMTRGIKDRLLRNNISSQKIFVVENGTNVKHFYPLDSNKRAGLKMKLIRTDKLVLGFIGNLSKWQGLDQLISAFENVLLDTKDLLLLIVGSGKYQDDLLCLIESKRLENSVIFKENIDYSEINNWMNIIDVAFAPKIKELDGITSPLKLRDYAASGHAVISTNIAGIREFKQYGWLRTYDPDDTTALENVIRNLVLDKKNIMSMSKKSRLYAEKFFSWDVVANAIISIDEYRY
jgi:glycosyltransferase involved in cell wall biosynthesis